VETFASFSYPRNLYFLPKSIGQLKKRAESRKVCGPYFQTRPNPNPINSFFYLGSDFMPGLRWEWADEASKHIRHTGWFCDDFQSETIRGLVMTLPHGRGFLAGWSMGEHMASEVGHYIYSDKSDAAHAADSLAERVAELNQESQEEVSE